MTFSFDNDFNDKFYKYTQVGFIAGMTNVKNSLLSSKVLLAGSSLGTVLAYEFASGFASGVVTALYEDNSKAIKDFILNTSKDYMHEKVKGLNVNENNEALINKVLDKIIETAYDKTEAALLAKAVNLVTVKSDTELEEASHMLSKEQMEIIKYIVPAEVMEIYNVANFFYNLGEDFSGEIFYKITDLLGIVEN